MSSVGTDTLAYTVCTTLSMILNSGGNTVNGLAAMALLFGLLESVWNFLLYVLNLLHTKNNSTVPRGQSAVNLQELRQTAYEWARQRIYLLGILACVFICGSFMKTVGNYMKAPETIYWIHTIAGNR